MCINVHNYVHNCNKQGKKRRYIDNFSKFRETGHPAYPDHRLSGTVKPDAHIEVCIYDSTAPVFTPFPFINK